MTGPAIKLRDYQLDAHSGIIKEFKAGKSPLLFMPPGAGKSITAISFIAKYKEIYNFVLVVRTRGLVFQIEEDLKTFDLDYSILMAGEDYDKSKSIVLCSKDTLQARNITPFLERENVVYIWDEADETPEFQQEIKLRFKDNKRFFFMGQTATPYRCLPQFDSVVTPITSRGLNERKILVDYKYFIPKAIDFSDVKIENGAWNAGDLKRKLDNPEAIKEAFESWLAYGDNRQTLIFSSSKDHSKRVTEYINSYYKKEVAVHCDSDTPGDERETAKKRFKNGEIRFISNVRLFTRGTDIPEIGCILDMAATLSLNLHIQKIGRGSRSNEFYNDLILIDAANNLLNNGHFYQEHEVNLTANYKKNRSDIETVQMRQCLGCFRAYEGADARCPFCNHFNGTIAKKKVSEYKKNKLFMESASEEAIEQRAMIKDFKKILWKKQNLGKRYRYDIAREKAVLEMLDKYGVGKCLKISKAIKLTDEIIKKFNEDKYVPLGGMKL